jgi:hypothetical protein
MDIIERMVNVPGMERMDIVGGKENVVEKEDMEVEMAGAVRICRSGGK